MREALAEAAECLQTPQAPAADHDEIRGLGGHVQRVEGPRVVLLEVRRDPWAALRSTCASCVAVIARTSRS